MSIWILAIVLLALFAAIGFAKGAIRMSISLVGMIIAVLAAVPAGRALTPLVKMAGVANPVWLALVPPVVAFILIYLVFAGLSFFAHHKVYLIYKYKRDDVDRIRWERMNRQVGAAVGMLTGTVLFFAVAGVIYAAGYLTVQLSAEDNNPTSIKIINSVRQDMADSGFDKAAAKFQPAPKLYFEAADVMGLLYHNPLLQGRLSTYPYFLSLGQRTEFKEIGTDKEYNDLIFGKAPVTQLIDHARTQTITGNSDILNYLKGTDLADLKEYLRTGKSPKYQDQEILGQWNLDKSAVLTFVRKANPDIKARELRLVRQSLESAPPLVLVVTPENKVFVVSAAAAAAPAADAAAAPEATPEAAALAARYGPEYARRMLGQPAAPAAAAAPTPPPAPKVVPELAGEGSWSEEAGQYLVSIPGASGAELKGTARVVADEMIMAIGGANLVFAKQ